MLEGGKLHISMASNMLVTNKQKKTGLVKLKGYILPEKKEEAVNETDDSDEENEAEQQPEFLDLTEINNVSSGGHFFQPSVVPLSKGRDVSCFTVILLLIQFLIT